MTSVYRFTFLAFVFLQFPNVLQAADDRELYKQRVEAQRERQRQVDARNRKINDARRDFRSFAQPLKQDYREQARKLDTDLKLRKVDIKAQYSTKIADAEAAFQSKVMGMYANPEGTESAVTPEQLSAETKAHADKVYALKKKSAEALHAARMATEKEKDALMAEMDQRALTEAESLGLTGTYAPVLASPIGGGLTDQERRWNEREKEAVRKQQEQNRKLLSEYRNGAKLRQWQMGNLDEDFRLTWEEKDKLHALEAEHKLVSSLMASANQGGKVDRQKWMQQIQELGEKQRHIKSEYRAIRAKNRITRGEERRAILAE